MKIRHGIRINIRGCHPKPKNGHLSSKITSSKNLKPTLMYAIAFKTYKQPQRALYIEGGKGFKFPILE